MSDNAPKRSKLTAIGERIKSSAKQPGPQIQRPHVARHTAGSSKMAPKLTSEEAIAAFDPANLQRCPAPVFGVGGRCYVDPASVPGIFSACRPGQDPTTGLAWGAGWASARVI